MSYQENVTHLGKSESWSYFKSGFFVIVLFFKNGLLVHLRKGMCPSLAVLLVLVAEWSSGHSTCPIRLGRMPCLWVRDWLTNSWKTKNSHYWGCCRRTGHITNSWMKTEDFQPEADWTFIRPVISRPSVLPCSALFCLHWSSIGFWMCLARCQASHSLINKTMEWL